MDFDEMDFDPDQCLASTKAIIKLTNSSEGSVLVKASTWNEKLEDDAVIFCNEDKQISDGYSSPLSVIALSMIWS